MNSIVSWVDSSSLGWNVGSDDTTTFDYHPWNWDLYHPWYERVRVEYYPHFVESKSKVEQAFKIVSKLMEKGIIKNLTVRKFVELVNDIAEII